MRAKNEKEDAWTVKEEGSAVSGDGSAERERDGSWWAGPSLLFVVVCTGVTSSLLAVVVVCHLSPVVVRSLSFVLVRRLFVVCHGRLASHVWGEVQWTALAIHCHWEVDGGRVALARRVAIEDGGTYSFIEHDNDDTIVVVVVCLVNPATPLPRHSWVHSWFCGPWAMRVFHLWKVVIIGGLHGLWSSFADSCCRC